MLVVAYGKILPKWLLNSPTRESVNIHFSLLPKYRGASPIQSALLNDEKVTGISVMRMTDGLDEGPVYFFHKQKILNEDNKNTLEKKLTSLAIKKLIKIFLIYILINSPQLYKAQKILVIAKRSINFQERLLLIKRKVLVFLGNIKPTMVGQVCILN